LIAVGTGIETFRLLESLHQKNRQLSVSFVMNEEPWQHKTEFAGAECRYPSELLALVENNEIRCVLCSTHEDFEAYSAQYGAALKARQCRLLYSEPIDSESLTEAILGFR